MTRLLWCAALLLGCDRSTAWLGIADAGAAGQIDHDTGQEWSIRWQPDLPTVAFMEGRTQPLAVTPSDAERAGRAFIVRYHDLFALGSDELQTESAETDELGMTHARFTQKRGRVPVWGGELRVHFAPDGALLRVNGRAIPVGEVDLVPARSADEARVAALLDAQAQRDEVDRSLFSSTTPSLWVLPLPSGAHLAWRVEVDVHDAARPMALEIFVDAADGAILQRRDTLRTVEGSGLGVFGDRQPLSIVEKQDAFWLEDPFRGSSPTHKTYSAAGRGHLPGTGVHSDAPDRWDVGGAAPGAAVDAHAFVARAWDYFRDVHGRLGWDGRNHGVHATVHFGQRFGGAFFDGRQLVFGDGDDDWAPAAGALDVVAHEYTHGLVRATAQLDPAGESGALDEAIADLFACVISRGQVPGGDWQIAESVYHPGGHARPLRDLANPHATGDAATMREYVEDVHASSTIASHAAYLMNEALGADAVARIWYRALTRYLTSESRFADAADATIAAARDYGRGEEAAVRAAWLTVGVVSR